MQYLSENAAVNGEQGSIENPENIIEHHVTDNEQEQDDEERVDYEIEETNNLEPMIDDVNNDYVDDIFTDDEETSLHNVAGPKTTTSGLKCNAKPQEVVAHYCGETYKLTKNFYNESIQLKKEELGMMRNFLNRVYSGEVSCAIL